MPKKKEKMSSVEICLGYYKRGDDYERCAEEKKDGPVNALRRHAAMLVEVQKHLLSIAECIEKHKAQKLIDIEGGVHFINFTGPVKLVKELLAKELVEPPGPFAPACENCKRDYVCSDCPVMEE